MSEHAALGRWARHGIDVALPELAPLRRKLSVYERLKGLVTNGRFRPHEKLHIVELAQALKVSATPIREALVRLSAEALIASEPGRGYHVRALDTDQAVDLYAFGHLVLRHAIKRNAEPIEHRQGGLCQTQAVGGTHRLRLSSVGGSGSTKAMPPPFGQAEALEKLYIGMTTRSGSPELARAIMYFNDRTHLLRLIDLEDHEVSRRSAELVLDLTRLLTEGEHSHIGADTCRQALQKIDAHFVAKMARAHLLVREAFGRTGAVSETDGAAMRAAPSKPLREP